MGKQAGSRSRVEFVKRTIIVAAIFLVPFLVWWLFGVVLIATGAMLMATLLLLVAEPLERWLRLPKSIALIAAGLIITGIFGGAVYLFGSQITSEVGQVFQRVQVAWDDITQMLQQSSLGRAIRSHLGGGELSITKIIGQAFTISSNVLGALVVTIFTGIYLAAQVGLYREGLGQMFPPAYRAQAIETIDDIGIALRLWLLGQLIQMIIIGVLSGFAAWIIGLPFPVGLGLIAAFTEFVPFIGPIVGAIPAVLVAATIGLETVLWTVAAYTLIQQAEGHLIQPLIQRKMVFIPPAVILLGIVTIAYLFGSIAMILAAPLVVMIFVAIKKLYIRDSLGEEASIPGEDQA